MAQRLQNKAIQEGDLWIWTVYANPSDLPGKFVARPFSSKLGGPFGFAIVADSLDKCRAALPWGLTRQPRNPADDPVVVEIWF
jgi:hypothetical protein